MMGKKGTWEKGERGLRKERGGGIHNDIR